ncbi:hypothetical protein DPMN_188078 [Dreissena polymorpha]|uniref:Uncharacterized protein n=1 Tax=Dreissena polymorpha TaxID=45954 RepID=A0A9D4DSS0_DREPO|nr:hypothetical protein DPMN_188078 [Dreissena polymorpha]
MGDDNYLSIDIIRTHDTVSDFAIHFHNKTAKWKDDLLMEIRQLGNFTHKELISDSKEKGNEFGKSVIHVKTIMQNVNASIDNFTSLVTDYIS